MRETASGEGRAPVALEATCQTEAMPVRAEAKSGEESGLRGRVEETTTPGGSPNRQAVAATKTSTFGLETVADRRATTKGLRGPSRPSMPTAIVLLAEEVMSARRRQGRQTGPATSKGVLTMHAVASGRSR